MDQEFVGSYRSYFLLGNLFGFKVVAKEKEKVMAIYSFMATSPSQSSDGKEEEAIGILIQLDALQESATKLRNERKNGRFLLANQSDGPAVARERARG